jgi:hypothetical protein
MLLEKKISNYDSRISYHNPTTSSNPVASSPKPIDIKKAIKYVAKAWENVTSTTIINCWKKTGILPLEETSINYEIENSTNIVNEISNREISDINNLINQLSFTMPLEAEEYIMFDDFQINNEMVTEEEIIASFNPAEEVVIENNTIPKVSTKDAVNAFETVFNFLQQGDLEIDYKEFKAFKSLKRKVTLLNNEKLIQPNIMHYFNK